jgi:Flp pilus assembly pilin Flp
METVFVLIEYCLPVVLLSCCCVVCLSFPAVGDGIAGKWDRTGSQMGKSDVGKLRVWIDRFYRAKASPSQELGNGRGV